MFVNVPLDIYVLEVIATKNFMKESSVVNLFEMIENTSKEEPLSVSVTLR